MSAKEMLLSCNSREPPEGGAGQKKHLEFFGGGDQRKKAARRAVNIGQKKPDHLIMKKNVRII
jgi:hypothetical protein